MAEIIKELQESQDGEMNYIISCFWDCGFTWKLGDPMNGYIDEGLVDTFELAMKAIIKSWAEHLIKPKKWYHEREREEADDSICKICKVNKTCGIRKVSCITKADVCIGFRPNYEEGP